MKTKRLMLLIVLSMILILQGAVMANDEIITWKICFSCSPNHIWGQAIQEWASLVTDGTQGKMQFQLYYYDALGNQKEVMEQMRMGVAHGNYALETLSYWVPEIDIYGTGYLFKDEAHLLRAQEGEIGRILEQKMIDAGFRPIFYFVRAPRNITSNKPINELSDLKGLKIRVPQAPANVALFQALGAQPITLPWMDVIPSLQAGVIDAHENPLDLIYDYKFWEVQKYIAMTEHQRQVIFVLISEQEYQKLPEEYKAVINKASSAVQESAYENFKIQEKELKELVEAEGMIFTYPDQEEFRKAAKSSYDKLKPEVQDLIKIAQEIE
jgi:tripartite ATP-independent transporter DctP family solute receptor